ncbi:MAG: hypothetical protein H6888_06145 [Nitratireductor sp.]|jgi:hypothetical protein|nr:hypothetical protein [Nitratireductor sp.]MCC0020641.1 hypothetical protein [Nitratireductor sp.]
MPQLIALALVGGLGWYAWKTLRREMDRIGQEVREAENKSKQVPDLELGPDGVYRPRRKDG